MFDNNNEIFAYKISLKLDEYLFALFNLCFDVKIKIENIEINNDEILHATNLFNQEFYTVLELNKDEFLIKDDETYISTKDELFESLASKLNNFYLINDDFLDKIKSKEFLYYFKDTKTIYSNISDFKILGNIINDRIKSLGIITKVINYLSSENLKESIKSIAKIYNFDKSVKFIQVSNLVLKPQVFKISKDFINPDLIEETIFDIEDFWFNGETTQTTMIQYDADNDEISLLKDISDSNVIGILVNDYVLLKYDIDATFYIIEDKKNEYLWQLLKENIFHKKQEGKNHNSDLINSFLEKSTESNFNKLLSNLKYNLYIDRDVEIQSNYKSFFEEFLMIRKLDELSDINLFLPDEDDSFDMISVYSEKKIGDKYNLLHHIKHKDSSRLIRFKDSNPIEERKEKINILKSDLSFYLVEKYFEDIIEKILKDNQVDYISNVELCINKTSKAEFDFIIFKNNKFYILEAKTTLSKDNVYQTLTKFNINIELLKNISSLSVDHFDFVLMGLLSHPNIDNYKFFLNEEVGYNTNREGFNVIPYKFQVPFFNHKGMVLNCISEPEISKLNDYIKEICQI